MRDGKRDGKDKVEGERRASEGGMEGTEGSTGSSPINVSDRGRGEGKMKEKDVHRGKCPANISDRAGGGGWAPIRHAEVCLFLIQPGEKYKNFSVSFVVHLYVT